MNQDQKDQLAEIAGIMEEAMGRLTAIKDEQQGKYDLMPEYLQPEDNARDAYYDMELEIEAMETALDQIEDSITEIKSIL